MMNAYNCLHDPQLSQTCLCSKLVLYKFKALAIVTTDIACVVSRLCIGGIAFSSTSRVFHLFHPLCDTPAFVLCFGRTTSGVIGVSDIPYTKIICDIHHEHDSVYAIVHAVPEQKMHRFVRTKDALRQRPSRKKATKAACFRISLKRFSRNRPQTELFHWLASPLFPFRVRPCRVDLQG